MNNYSVGKKFGAQLGLITFCVVVVGLSLNNMVQQVAADPVASPSPTPSGSPPSCSACRIGDMGLSYHYEERAVRRTDNGTTLFGASNERNRGASSCCQTGADPSNCNVISFGRWGDVEVYCTASNINCQCQPTNFASGGSGSGSGGYGSGATSAGLFGQAGFGSLNKQSMDDQLRSDLAQRRFAKQ